MLLGAGLAAVLLPALLLAASPLGTPLLAALLLGTGPLWPLLPDALLTARPSTALLCLLTSALWLHLVPPLVAAGRLLLVPLSLLGSSSLAALRRGLSPSSLGRPLLGRRSRAGLVARRLLARRRVPPHRLAGRLLAGRRLALLALRPLLTLPRLPAALALLGPVARLSLSSRPRLLALLSAPSLSASLLRLRTLARLPALAAPLRLLTTVLGLGAGALGLLAPVCVLRTLVHLSAPLSLAADVALRSLLIARPLTGLLVDAVLVLPSVVVVVVSHGFS